MHFLNFKSVIYNSPISAPWQLKSKSGYGVLLWRWGDAMCVQASAFHLQNWVPMSVLLLSVLMHLVYNFFCWMTATKTAVDASSFKVPECIKKNCKNSIWSTFLGHQYLFVISACLIKKKREKKNDEIELIIFNVSFHTQLTMTSFQVMQPYKHVIIAKTIKRN